MFLLSQLGYSAYALREGVDALPSRAAVRPVWDATVSAVFAQAGFRVGATLEGVKYTRIIP